MTLRLALSLLCGVAYVGGLVVMKFIFAIRASRSRGISFLEASATTAWLRDDAGRFRWFVVGWAIFWFGAAVAVGSFVR